jgi:hypothetical protein
MRGDRPLDLDHGRRKTATFFRGGGSAWRA